jgi:hypothetical protein
MVAAGSLFLLCLTASSYHCRHGHTADVRRHLKPLFGVKSSSVSRSSTPRRDDEKKSSLSAQSAGIEGQIDEDVKRSRLDIDHQVWRWERKYLLLKQFNDREGHCRVPYLHQEDEANLGAWVNNQRQLKTKDKLDSDRQRQLEDIGFEWVLFSAKWDEMYALLQQFKKREGHCRVLFSHQEDEANLGWWATTQRYLKTKDKLDPDRQKWLEDIGFEWGLPSAKRDEIHALLQQFKKREGHCKVPQFHREDGVQLGQWVKTQRQLKRKEKLDPDRQKWLEDIGFEWGLPAATWDESYALLQQFKKREGHCNVPKSHQEDKANLGIWVSNQRQLKTKDKLDSDRQGQLEQIGFEWVLHSAKRDEIHALLQQFKKREGHCKVPQFHREDGVQLGQWVKTQHQLKRKEKLDPDRQKWLEDIGFEWGLPAATWDESCALLKQFKKREGHCNVPNSHQEDEANLGYWVSNQRQLKTKEKLDPDRLKRLEEIGFNWARRAKVP